MNVQPFDVFYIFFFKQDTITTVKDNKKPRPLYEVPYMFEAREFLRKKLIGKKVIRNFYSSPGLLIILILLVRKCGDK